MITVCWHVWTIIIPIERDSTFFNSPCSENVHYIILCFKNQTIPVVPHWCHTCPSHSVVLGNNSVAGSWLRCYLNRDCRMQVLKKTISFPVKRSVEPPLVPRLRRSFPELPKREFPARFEYSQSHFLPVKIRLKYDFVLTCPPRLTRVLVADPRKRREKRSASIVLPRLARILTILADTSSCSCARHIRTWDRCVMAR